MAEAARNEWDITETVIDRLREHAVIAPLDVTPFRQTCQVWGCSKDSHRERVIGQQHPYVFACDYGHQVPTAATYLS